MKWFLSLVVLLGSSILPSLCDDSTSNNRGLVDLVDLVPFDVQIALTEDKGIQTFEVTDLVTEWLNDSFRRRLEENDYADDDRYAAFDTVILLDKGNSDRRRRQLEDSSSLGVLYTARFEGVALFARDETRPFKVPAGDVLEIQRQAIKEDDPLLLEALVASNARGLGDPVAAVNAYLSPVANQPATTEGDDKDDQLQLVIIIAVCVACVAFVCLVGAIVWAWRNDRDNRAAYRVEAAASSEPAGKNGKPHHTSSDQDRTGSDTTEDDVGSPDKTASPPGYFPREVYGGGGERYYGSGRYPESVISEDISTALSAYYRSGLGGTISSNGLDFVRNPPAADAVSVSSMESYGYSLDGRSYNVEAFGAESLMRENSDGLGSAVDDIEEEEEDNVTAEPVEHTSNPPGRKLQEP